MDASRTCPYCAETISPEALRCPHCRSRLATLDPGEWHRDHPDRRLAGVAAAVAHAFGVTAGAVRLGFVVLTFVHLAGPILYGALWLLLPPAAGEESVLERGLGRAHDAVRRLRSAPTVPPGPSA